MTVGAARAARVVELSEWQLWTTGVRDQDDRCERPGHQERISKIRARHDMRLRLVLTLGWTDERRRRTCEQQVFHGKVLRSNRVSPVASGCGSAFRRGSGSSRARLSDDFDTRDRTPACEPLRRELGSRSSKVGGDTTVDAAARGRAGGPGAGHASGARRPDQLWFRSAECSRCHRVGVRGSRTPRPPPRRATRAAAL